MRNYAENAELCGIVRRTGNCAISHSPHLNVASVASVPQFHMVCIYICLELVISFNCKLVQTGCMCSNAQRVCNIMMLFKLT